MPNALLLASWKQRLAPVIALLAGLCYPLAFAPYHQSWLLLVSLAVLWWLLPGNKPKTNLLLGYCYGLGQFGLGVSWVYVSMHHYGGTGITVSIILTTLFILFLAIFPALTCWLATRLSKQYLSPLLLIACWMGFDWLRGWVSSGFPWLYAGYAVIDTPLADLAAYGGVWLVTLVILCTGLVFGQCLSRRFYPLVGLLAIIGWTASWYLPTTPGVQPTKSRQAVSLVQGNIPQSVKWQLSQQVKTRKIYAKLTDSIGNKDQLVIWPESAITEFYSDIRDWINKQGEKLAEAGGALISGLPRVVPGLDFRPVFYNSIIVIAGGSGIYNKQKLVPFGEYVPFASLIRGLVPFFDLPMSSFTAGGGNQANLYAQGISIAPFVCYDILFPGLVAHQAINSNVLLEVSDDAWFGKSAAPWQHMQMARMRSIETGRYLLRDTNNGVTAIIDSRGRITSELPQFTRGILQGSYQPVTGKTPFMTWGQWLSPLITLLIFVAGFVLSRRGDYKRPSE